MAGPRPCAWPDDASQSSALGSGGLVSESTSAVIDLVEQTHTAPAWEGVFWGCSLRVRVWDSPWGQWGNRRELSSWGPFVLELVGLQGALCRSICPPRRGTADLMTNSQVTRAVCVLDWCAPRPGWLLPTLNHQTIYPSWFCSLVLGVYPPLSPRDRTVYILFGNYDLSWDSLDERDFCNLKFFWHDLWKSESVSCSFVSESFVPQWTVALVSHGSSDPWNSPGKNTGVGCHFLLQRIFPTQRWNPCLLRCRWMVYLLSHQGSPEWEWEEQTIIGYFFCIRLWNKCFTNFTS